ncbi:DUF4199 domain-containing protein [Echinicola sp. CAU 1574]|uniref:DUF4199 domain-containing protein n=1 Tax=Echinicola arenosa TaxID=2774144 RepID=A0ABR9AMW5_9BACT|nr:DUF4199 domain-containing protein [Echinicola arenosa]MBD8490151.1 DUF4199 domain-containing protein [Echinicola arenosa]
METQETPFRAALRSGLIIGMIMLVITFLVYFIDTSMLTKWWFGLLALAIFCGLVIFFGTKYRNDIGGYINFGPAFQFAFITLVITGLISVVGNILLYQVIDPALPQVLADQQLENTMSMMESFGAGDSMSSEQIDEMKQGFEDAYTIGGQLKGFGIALIIYAILALILGAIIKKKDKSLSY